MSIEVDDAHPAVIMRRYRLRTKSEAVALALRRLAGKPMTRDEALAMEGAEAVDEVPADRPPRLRRWPTSGRACGPADRGGR